MKKNGTRITAFTLAAVLAMTFLPACGKEKKEDGTLTLTNVSYDPTRELYEEYNKAFQKHYQEETGKKIEIVQSHGGSGSQARSVIEGSDADVVTLALAHDITLIEKAGLIESGWLKEFEGNSSPYTSTIVFLVRKGNEKEIKDWDDLVKEGVDVITPDPKSSGGACWNFLAAWEYASETYGSEEEVKEFVTALYKNVSVMDSGARGATTTFVENGQGDVLIAWENEALSTVEEYPDKYEIITPSVSILAEPSVAIVDENADKDGTQEAAKDYLEYLYSDEAQRIIGEKGYRPFNPDILQEFSDKFNLNINLCTIDDFGGWDAAYETFFVDGGIFDEIYDN
ncbi:sulfate ABC transporter substrate-binding protein [Roseburia sp. 499]|uniref:sulfate ABC transporter substrate-binding protein n=1 Tax=Roseburia sp. 499 TaxID=1261634 RepID=UPI000950D411